MTPKPRIDLLGRKFGKLTPIEFLGFRKGGAVWLCKCDCGTIKEIKASYLISGDSKSCHCSWRLAKHRWTGFEEISGSYLYKLRAHAKTRHLSYDVSNEYIWDLFLKQERLCALSGVPIQFARRIVGGKQTASLDRIDSKQGYFEGNVQWIHKELQIMKWDKPDSSFISWCKVIADYQRIKEASCPQISV